LDLTGREFPYRFGVLSEMVGMGDVFEGQLGNLVLGVAEHYAERGIYRGEMEGLVGNGHSEHTLIEHPPEPFLALAGCFPEVRSILLFSCFPHNSPLFFLPRDGQDLQAPICFILYCCGNFVNVPAFVKMPALDSATELCDMTRWIQTPDILYRGCCGQCFNRLFYFPACSVV
jgi:hypothetical protein